MGRLLFAAALLAVLLMASCAPKTVEPAPWQYQIAEDMREQILRGEQVAADIRLGALEFSGAEMAEEVNENLLAFREERMALSLAHAEQLLAEAEFNGSLPQDQVYYMLTESPAVHYNNGRYLSLVIEGYEHMQNAPHPRTWRFGYTFDALSGQKLSLEHVWGEGARERAAREIYAQIEDSLLFEEDFFPGLEENLLIHLDADDWYMDRNYIYIIYNPYEIAPYAMGIQEFKLAR